MGRPLNKKYFGNRNIGSTGTGDNYGIGGEGLAAYTLDAQKGVVAITNTYKYFPTLTIPAPNLSAGVQATATVVWELNAVSVSSGGSGYTINQTGAAVTAISGSIWTDASTQPSLTINTDGTGAVTAIAIATGGRGEWTNIDGTGIATWAITGAGGTNAQITATFRLKSITTVEKGSGYTSAPTLSWARASSQKAGGQTQTGTPTVALTADSGAVGSSTNQENAIIIYANTSGAGSTGKVGDIVKQTNTRSYKVTTADGTKVCKLGTDDTPADGYAYIIATDSSNATYYVTKLTAHKAVLVNKTGTPEFADGTSVVWTFGSAEEDYSVTIENA